MTDTSKTAVLGDYSQDQPSKWHIKFTCECGNKWETDAPTNWDYCPKCGERVEVEVVPEVPSRPLTKQEARKLSWYRDEKKWIADIESRRLMPNGNVAIVDHKGKVVEVRDKNGN